MMCVTVLLSEEYGYRYWRWRTSLSSDELKEWWEGLESVHALRASTLPGSVEQVHGEEGRSPFLGAEGAWEAHLHLNDNSWLAPPDGELITHAGYEPA